MRIWQLEVLGEDERPGLSNTSNRIVVFFTTEQGGPGIGPVLALLRNAMRFSSFAIFHRDRAEIS
jgi:hypothetical protein